MRFENVYKQSYIRAHEMGGAHLCAKLKVDFSQTEVAVKDFEAFFLGGVNFSFFTKVALMSNSSRTRVEVE